MKNSIELKSLLQIAFVVKDIEKSAKVWADFFNVPVPKIDITEPHHDPRLTYRGQEGYYGQKLAVIRTDSFIIELLQPTGGPSTFQEFLDKHGQGLHHLGFDEKGQRDLVVREFEEKGYQLRTIGIHAKDSWTIVDTEDDLGTNLNIKGLGLENSK
jgi:hypothetical protein